MSEHSSGHPAKEDIRALLSGKLSEDMAQGIEEHLSDCSTCSQWIEAETQTVDGFNDKVRSALQRENLLEKIPPLNPGTLIGKYKLVRLIAEGGMGAVYLADQTEHIERQVALKVIRSGSNTDRVIARFEAERQAQALMNHVNIASVFDAGITSAGQPYFVMEYFAGEPITEYCDKNRLTIAQRLELFAVVCRAIQHAHQKGIIHRDIKPSNILVAEDDGEPVIKIIDFGIAKLTNDRAASRTKHTMDGQIIGTIGYMSPEQADLSDQDVDTQSDVYSLGIVLYELLCGSCPLTWKEQDQLRVQQLLLRITESNWDRPSFRVCNLPISSSIPTRRRASRRSLTQDLKEELDWIALKALERDKGRRYATADALALDVRRHLQHKPVDACPPSTLYQLRKFSTRHKPFISTVVIFVVVLSCSVVATTRMAVRASRAETKAFMERDLARQATSEAEAARAAMFIEKQRAETESLIAKSVSDFLEDGILGQANIVQLTPTDAAPEPDLTVRTALDRAADMVDSMFPNQPLVEAAVRKTIGVSYRELGIYDKAEEHLIQAFEIINRDTVDSTLEQRLAIKNSLALLYISRGEYEEADKYVEEGARLWMDGTNKDQEACAAVGNLAHIYMKRGKYNEAEKIRRDVLAQLNNRDTYIGLMTTHNLAALLYQQSRYTEAESYAVEAEQIALRIYGNQHPLTVSVRSQVALLWLATGRHSEASKLLDNLLKMRLASLGDTHPRTLRAMNDKAAAMLSTGRTVEGISLMKKTLELRIKTIGEKHPDTIKTLGNLATGYQQANQLDKAESAKLRLVELAKQVHGDEHPMTLLALNNLSELYRVKGRLAEAEELKKEVLATRTKVLGPKHRQTLTAMNNLGILYYALKDYERAEELLSEATRLRKITLGANHPESLQALENLAMTLAANNHFKQAARQFEELATVQAAQLNQRHPRYALTLSRLGRCLLHAGEVEKGRSELERAVEIFERSTPNGWRLQIARAWLAQCDIAENKYEDAEAVLLDAYTKITTSQSCPKRQLEDLREIIVSLYEAWGKSTEAAKWKAPIAHEKHTKSTSR